MLVRWSRIAAPCRAAPRIATVARLAIALALFAVASGASAAELPRVDVAILYDGPWTLNEQIRGLTEREILALTEREFDVRFDHVRTGDWSREASDELLANALADPEIDLIVTFGLLGSNAACHTGAPQKPIIAPVVVDPVIQNCPRSAEGGSGVPRFTYVALQNTLRDELEMFQRVTPFRRVAILGYGEFIDAVPGLRSRYLDEIRAAGFDAEFIPVGRSVDRALAALDDTIEAAYVWPQFQLDDAETQRLVDELNERRIPTFSAIGGLDLTRGMLAAATTDEFFPRLARRIALNAQRILLGEPAETIPTLFTPPTRLTINMATAHATGISPRWETLVEAELLLDGVEPAPSLSLHEAVTEALGANLDLAVSSLEIDRGELEVERARSRLRPQADLSLSGLQIDDDRAAASFGSQPERSLLGGVGVSQLLFSESARGAVSIERSLQRGREYEYESARLDVMLTTATTYLNLLRAETLVAVQRSNVEVTRSNLELARSRREVGAASSAEVFRWESQIATDRRSLIDSIADLRTAKITVNRLLHRPLAQPFETVEVGLDEPNLITNQARFRGFIETPRRFSTFAEWILEDAIARVPELQALEASIDAQERALTIANRSFWAPTVALQLSLEELVASSGAGADTAAAPGQAATDDTNWSAAISGSLPLYTGGLRAAEAAQSEVALVSLRQRYAAVREAIEAQILSGMEATRASYSGIRLSDEAATAARRNLDLVSDAYSRGAISIIDLIDAQNAALAADLQAANAVYDFLINLLGVQRATGRFDFFEPIADRDLWFDRLEGFFAERGIPPLPAWDGRAGS